MQPLTVKAREPVFSSRDGAPHGEPGLAEIVKSTAADVVHLASAELRLAKLELTDGVRAQAGRVALLAVGAIPLAVGYLLGVAALIAWVRPWLGLPGALAAVALSQVVIGGVIMAMASGRRSGNSSGRGDKQSGSRTPDGMEASGA